MHDPVTVAPAAVADLSTEPLPGTLLEWRWTDRERGRWAGLVRVRTPTALQYERWIGGEHLRRAAGGVTPAATPPDRPRTPIECL